MVFQVKAKDRYVKIRKTKKGTKILANSKKPFKDVPFKK